MASEVGTAHLARVVLERKDLDRNDLIVRVVKRLEHLAERALAQRLEQREKGRGRSFVRHGSTPYLGLLYCTVQFYSLLT